MSKRVKLIRPLTFEWDEGNLKKNLVRHNVKNEETEQVFFNNPVIMPDRTHSVTEERHFAFGITNKRRFLLISFTLRGEEKEKIRPIMSRDQNKKERKYYNEQKKEVGN